MPPQEKFPQLNDQERKFLQDICANNLELYQAVAEIVCPTTREELQAVPARLRELSSRNSLAIGIEDVIALTVFARGYFLKSQGQGVFLQSFLHPDWQAFIKGWFETELDVHSVRRTSQDKLDPKSTTSLQNKFGMIDEAEENQALVMDRLQLIKRIAMANVDRLPSNLVTRRDFELLPQETYSDLYYLVSMAATKYYGQLFELATSYIQHFENAKLNTRAFMLGLQNFLRMKLANQPYRDIYAQLQRFVESTSLPTNRQMVAEEIGDLYVAEKESDSDSPRSGLVYALAYSRLVRSLLRNNISMSIGDLDSKFSDLVYEMWEFLSGIRSYISPVFDVKATQHSHFQESFLSLMQTLGQLQVQGKKSDSLVTIAEAQSKLEALLSYMQQEGITGNLLSPTQLITLPDLRKRAAELADLARSQLDTIKIKQDKINGINLQIDAVPEDEFDLESADTSAGSLVERITSSPNLVRMLNYPNILPFAFPEATTRALAVYELSAGELAPTDLKITNLLRLWQTRSIELEKFLSATDTIAATQESSPYTQGRIGATRYHVDLNLGSENLSLRNRQGNLDQYEPIRGVLGHMQLVHRLQSEWLEALIAPHRANMLNLEPNTEYDHKMHVERNYTKIPSEMDVEMTYITGELQFVPSLMLIPDSWEVEPNRFVHITTRGFVIAVPVLQVTAGMHNPPRHTKEIDHWKPLRGKRMTMQAFRTMTYAIPTGKAYPDGAPFPGSLDDIKVRLIPQIAKIGFDLGGGES
jgi:hypothetical protein